MTALASYPNFDFIPLRLEYAFDDAWWRMITPPDRDRPQLAIELGKDGLYTEGNLKEAFSRVRGDNDFQ